MVVEAKEPDKIIGVQAFSECIVYENINLK